MISFPTINSEKVQTRHVIIVETPGEHGAPGRGDIDVFLSQCDSTSELVASFNRKMAFPNDEMENDLSLMVPDGPWSRETGYDALNPDEELDLSNKLLDALRETIRILEDERPAILLRVKAWRADQNQARAKANEIIDELAKEHGASEKDIEKIKRAIAKKELPQPRITDFGEDRHGRAP